ncbi:MAG: hypothetical protein QXX20_02035 [Candidatus Thermoplasmatota archaeon]
MKTLIKIFGIWAAVLFVAICLQPIGMCDQSGYATIVQFKADPHHRIRLVEGILEYNPDTMSIHQVGWAVYDKYTHQLVGVILFSR